MVMGFFPFCAWLHYSSNKITPIAIVVTVFFFSWQAQGGLAFPGIPNASGAAWLACESCSRESAEKICEGAEDVPASLKHNRHPHSHLCTRDELAAGALLIARTMGWIDAQSPRTVVWDLERTKLERSPRFAETIPRGATPQQKAAAYAVGTGICCTHDAQ